jgi:Kef-type K+ transport system membrane component KefB
MAVASSNAIVKIRDYAKKISVIFSPVFFVLAGAQFNYRSFITSDLSFYAFFVVLLAIAVISKMIGCGIPAAVLLKDRSKGFKVGVGMISRGEVGLIVAGVAITAQVITQSTYSAIVSMVIITTIITPVLLRIVYDRDARKEKTASGEIDVT